MESRTTRENGDSLRKGRGRRQALPRKGSRRGSLGRTGSQVIPRYSMVIQWSDEDAAYVVTLPEFQGCKTHGETYQEAVKHGREVMELLVESCLDEGRQLPKPIKLGTPFRFTAGIG